MWYLPGAIRVEAVITMPGVYGTLRCWAGRSAGRMRRAARNLGMQGMYFEGRRS
jgi:hypothetical protein